MLTQESTIMDIENVITNRVESDLKDCKLPAPKEDRLDAMCQNQQLRSIQLNNCFAAKTARQSPALGGGSLNFSTSSEDIDMAFAKKPKTIRDPMSHRIIEKRRRDRMNNCLADLSRLIPTNYLKQGQGRIEKTEIIEMAIKLIKDLTTSVSQPHGTNTLQSSLPDRYLGFKECQDEVMRYLVEVEGWDAMDQLCNRLMSHLEQAGEKFRIMNDESLSKVAKEEQYRHADEEMGSCHELKKPFIFKPVEQQPPIYPQPQMAPYPTPINPQVMMSSPVPPVPQEPSPMETQPIYPSFNNFSSAQQITQEHLKRDKHLWTLLQSQYSSTTVDDSGISTDPGSGSSNVTEGDKFSEQNAASNFKTLSDTSSANSSSGGTMDSSSEKNGSSVYKFKHNITKRFSQEEKKVNPSDTSSSSSREDKRAEKGKRKYRHVRSRSPSSSHFKNIEALANATGSNEESSNRLNAEDIKLSNYLPAFVLHPIGTHYIPFSIHPSSIGSEVFSKKGSSQNIYHPISIPVNFGGPLLHMERFSIHSDSSASYGSTGSSSADSPSGCSAENSSTCNSENSPSPDQEGFKTQT